MILDYICSRLCSYPLKVWSLLTPPTLQLSDTWLYCSRLCSYHLKVWSLFNLPIIQLSIFCPQNVAVIQWVLWVKPATRLQDSVRARPGSSGSAATDVPPGTCRLSLWWRPALVSQRVVQFAIQIGSDWSHMGQICDFLRSVSVHFGAGAPKCTETDLKKSQICPIWG